MFNGHALQLLNIGRGYSRRLTFQADSNTLNNNNNYFWSDSRPEGFAFELEVVSAGDKFTLQDTNHTAAGTLEILQNSVSYSILSDNCCLPLAVSPLIVLIQPNDPTAHTMTMEWQQDIISLELVIGSSCRLSGV